MTQVSYTDFLIKIMSGNPNFDSIVKQVQEFGCQQNVMMPWVTPSKGEKPRAYLQRILTLHTNSQDQITIVYFVACGQRILPIPDSLETKATFLKLLSGRRHQIWVGLACQINSKIKLKLSMTRVSFKPLSDADIKNYSSDSEGYNCSGGYDPSGKASRFIKSICGSPSALYALPAFEFNSLITTWRAQCHG